jgi:hypothetical protein
MCPFHLFQDLGWSVLVHVDSLTYRFLGAPEEPFVNVNVTDMVVTPTQTVISAQAGPMQVTLTFINPIEVRLEPSIPFSIHLCIHYSLVIWSSNRYRSHTFLSLQYPRTTQPTRCKCTLTSLEVRDFVP